MKNMIIFAALVLVALSSTIPAVAQNGVLAPYATASIGVTSGSVLNQTNPAYILGAGIESSTKWVLADVNATYNTANNKVAGQGYTVTSQSSVYAKVLKYGLVGVGVNDTINHITAKKPAGTLTATTFESFHPYVGVGYQTTKFRALASYLIPAKDAVNNEQIVNLTGEVFATKHVRVTGGVLLDSAIPVKSSPRQLSIGAQAGIKLVL